MTDFLIHSPNSRRESLASMFLAQFREDAAEATFPANHQVSDEGDATVAPMDLFGTMTGFVSFDRIEEGALAGFGYSDCLDSFGTSSHGQRLSFGAALYGDEGEWDSEDWNLANRKRKLSDVSPLGTASIHDIEGLRSRAPSAPPVLQHHSESSPKKRKTRFPRYRRTLRASNHPEVIALRKKDYHAYRKDRHANAEALRRSRITAALEDMITVIPEHQVPDERRLNKQNVIPVAAKTIIYYCEAIRRLQILLIASQ